MQPQRDTTEAAVNQRPDQLEMDRIDRPETVLSVLEADQLVAAKERTHLGRAKLSPGARVLLWGLRLYVIAMLIMVAMQVVNALRGGTP